MELQTITTWQVILLLLTAVAATFLAWVIVRIIYRKSLKEIRDHKFDEKT